ncbi:hypothetical protein [Nocardia sp. X0981]
MVSDASEYEKAKLYRTLELEERFHHLEQKTLVGAALCGLVVAEQDVGDE